MMKREWGREKLKERGKWIELEKNIERENKIERRVGEKERECLKAKKRELTNLNDRTREDEGKWKLERKR